LPGADGCFAEKFHGKPARVGFNSAEFNNKPFRRMGQSLSWVAVRGKSEAELERMLGFRSTGTYSHYGEHALVGRRLGEGWYLLVAKGCNDRIIEPKVLAQLSKKGQAIACAIEEHMTFSACALWTGGRRRWSVAHRGDKSVFDLAKSGKVPKQFASLRHALVEKQKSAGGERAEVDHLFELPLQLAKELAGFKHDEDAYASGGAYEILELNYLQRVARAGAAAKSWLYVAGALLGVAALIGFIGVVAH
jgi:hypothetical protein